MRQTPDAFRVLIGGGDYRLPCEKYSYGSLLSNILPFLKYVKSGILIEAFCGMWYVVYYILRLERNIFLTKGALKWNLKNWFLLH